MHEENTPDNLGTLQHTIKYTHVQKYSVLHVKASDKLIADTEDL